jgi:hypothetical protein
MLLGLVEMNVGFAKVRGEEAKVTATLIQVQGDPEPLL